MARRKRRGGRRGMRIGKYVNWAFKIAGLGVALAPAIKGVQDNLSNPLDIPAGVGFQYTGYNAKTGTFDQNQPWKGLGAIVAGLVIAKAGGYIARRF